MAARKAGADMIKIFPCSQVGGPAYIKALKAPSRMCRLSPRVASINRPPDFIRKGAAALGIRGELIPPRAIERRDENWIHELAGRFLGFVQNTRVEFGLQ